MFKGFFKKPLFSRPYPKIVKKVLKASLSYLDKEALNDLYSEIKYIEGFDKRGILIEAGCALGGSAIVMASAKAKSRPFYVYDVFGMIPPPSSRDGEDVHERYGIIRDGKSEGIGGRKYYGYEQNLLEIVRANFQRYGFPCGINNVFLIKGLFQDTLKIDGTSVALAHIDGDWFESVVTCLERITPVLAPGGVMIIDDYYHWSGCRKAVDEYFSERRDDFDFIQKSRLHIRRKFK